MRNKFYIALTALIILLGLMVSANAQKKEVNRSLKFKGIELITAKEAARNGQAKIDYNVLAQVESAYADVKHEANRSRSGGIDNLHSNGNRLTGTWNVVVPGANPEDTFYALHTFSDDGTFVETSSLLASLIEGPAHGIWSQSGRSAVLTFELFAFDAGKPVGRVRVRNFILHYAKDKFTAYSVVDFIEMDGTVIPSIATGVFHAERLHLQ